MWTCFRNKAAKLNDAPLLAQGLAVREDLVQERGQLVFSARDRGGPRDYNCSIPVHEIITLPIRSDRCVTLMSLRALSSLLTCCRPDFSYSNNAVNVRIIQAP